MITLNNENDIRIYYDDNTLLQSIIYKRTKTTREMTQKASQARNMNPKLFPIPSEDITSLKELEMIYINYKLLTIDHQRKANSICMGIYGEGIEERYKLLKSIFLSKKIKDNDIVIDKSISSYINPTLQSHMDYITNEATSSNRNKVNIANKLLDLYNSKNDMNLVEAISVDRFIKDTIDTLNNPEIDYSLNILPYFTPDDLLNLGIYQSNPEDNFYGCSTGNNPNWIIEYKLSNRIDFKPWYKQLLEAYSDLIKDNSNLNKQKVLELGWNPEIFPTMTNIIKSSKITKQAILDKLPKVVDIQDDDNDTIEEASLATVLVPVFIITVFTGTEFGKLITKYTDSIYSHAGLALDHSLKHIYSFNFHTDHTGGGFSDESIEGYKKENSNGKIKVSAIFVTKTDFSKLKAKLDDYITNKNKSHYNVLGILDILVNRSKKSSNDLNMICSQFVDTMLKGIDLDITNKTSNLVLPKDIAESKFDKIVNLFEGLIKDYNPRAIARKVNKFLSSSSIKESTFISEIKESYVFSKNDLYINFEKFEKGDSNICLITGLSGSGKSTLGNSLATKYKAEYIELDIFEHCYGMTDKQLQQAGKVFYTYLSSNKVVWDNLKNRTLTGKELGKEISKFVHYCISWCNNDKSNKYIIEGVQIYSFMTYKEINSYPLVVKNTSMLKSIIQRWKRNGNGKIELMKELKNEFPQLIMWYIENEKEFNKFKKCIIKESLGMNEKNKLNDYKESTSTSEIENSINSILESRISTKSIKSFPSVEFSKDGNLIIKKSKHKLDFTEEYYKSVKLLKIYAKQKNTEGLSYELSKLWFMNNVLEHKLYTSDTKDKTELNKIRGKILNTYNTYLKILCTIDKSFNFQEYYDSTPFSDNVVISKNTISNVISITKDLLKF